MKMTNRKMVITMMMNIKMLMTIMITILITMIMPMTAEDDDVLNVIIYGDKVINKCNQCTLSLL